MQTTSTLLDRVLAHTGMKTYATQVDEFLNRAHLSDKWCQVAADMKSTVEDSPWHREANVWVHTQMVVDQYRQQVSEDAENFDLGYAAVAFHDVGKPSCRIEKHSAERGTYFAYHGHEKRSARMFVDWAVENKWDARSIFITSWMIENHMPWANTKSSFLTDLKHTCEYDGGFYDIFKAALRADQRGRISDDSAAKLERVEAWLDQLDSALPWCAWFHHDRVMYVPIGPTGSGKSTLTSKLIAENDDVGVFSLDAVRHKRYNTTDYASAYQQSVDDSTFRTHASAEYRSTLKKHHKVLILDNTNLTPKSRREMLTAARREGYQTVAVPLFTQLQTVISRQHTRTDKCVPAHAVTQQYYSVSLPSMGEVDDIQPMLGE